MMNQKGQALIETAVFFLALSVLLGGLAGFTKWFVIRQRLLLAAKEGALLYSSGHWTRSEVEDKIKQFLMDGSPSLNPDGIRVSVGPMNGITAHFWELDESIAEYTPPGGWHYLLGAPPTMSEKFVVKHAPHYWAPIPNIPHLPKGGPAVPYGS